MLKKHKKCDLVFAKKYKFQSKGWIYFGMMKMLKEQIVAEARSIVEKYDWIFAKTYAKTAPHEYALSKNNGEDKELERLAEIIEKYGETEYFYGHKGKYFYIDNLKYWGSKPEHKGVWNLNRGKGDLFYGEQKPKSHLRD